MVFGKQKTYQEQVMSCRFSLNMTIHEYQDRVLRLLLMNYVYCYNVRIVQQKMFIQAVNDISAQMSTENLITRTE